MDKALLSTGKDDWETPSELFQELDKIFHFTLDAAATHKNHKVAKYYTKETDGLAQDWSGEVVFCNPPYSKKTRNNPGQEEWIRKAYESSLCGATVVMLLPSRTDTKAFHKYILPCASIKFLPGRLRFEIDGKSCGPAPFASMIVVFGLKKEARDG